MEKQFDKWTEVKKEVNKEKHRNYNVREIWWCRLGVNIGTEQDGGDENYSRPVLILRGFGAEGCLVAPLTTSARVHPLRISVGEVSGAESFVNISQLRTIDTRRLGSKIGFLSKDFFKVVRKAVKDLF
jgi:mRNA-degrading endonuclease toxin of MazEF toxin-antitoxin module